MNPSLPQDLQRWRDNLLVRYQQENPSLPLLRFFASSGVDVLSVKTGKDELSHEASESKTSVEFRLYLLFGD